MCVEGVERKLGGPCEWDCRQCCGERSCLGVQRRTFLKSESEKSQNETESTKLLAVAAELFILYRDWTDGMAERQLNTNMIYFRLRTVKVLGMIHS